MLNINNLVKKQKNLKFCKRKNDFLIVRIGNLSDVINIENIYFSIA